jgi:hypothetical protein
MKMRAAKHVGPSSSTAGTSMLHLLLAMPARQSVPSK